MRSKSEVIIANLLHAKGLEYAYEQPFVAADDSVRYPDFTIDDPELGVTVIWEHLGSINNSEYRRRWERKLASYAENGVTPEGGSRGTLVWTADGSSEGDGFPSARTANQ